MAGASGCKGPLAGMPLTLRQVSTRSEPRQPRGGGRPRLRTKGHAHHKATPTTRGPAADPGEPVPAAAAGLLPGTCS